jgi:phosphoribosylformylglycinamidine synthase
MALAGGVGATLRVDAATRQDAPMHGWLFGEGQGRYIVAVAEAAAAEVLALAATAGVPARPIGATCGERLTLAGLDAISLADLRARHDRWFPAYMARPA